MGKIKTLIKRLKTFLDKTSAEMLTFDNQWDGQVKDLKKHRKE